MRTLLFTIAVFLLISKTAHAMGGARAVEPDKMAVAHANNAFAVDLYHHLSARDGNLLFSSYSIASALAMTYGGARGKTATEMAGVLHIPPADRKIHARFKALNSLLDNERQGKDVQLHMANSLWPKKNHPFQPQYLDLIQGVYNASISPMDFIREPEASRQAINSWAAKKTMDKITDLIAPGNITSETVMVLCNAIYFKGRWAVPFNPERTRALPFYIADSQQISVPTMRRMGTFRYREMEGVQVLEMPYQGKHLSMVVLLPSSTLKLKDLEARLDVEYLHNGLSGMKQRLVRVYLPKFTITWGSHDLVPALSQLGMKKPFVPAEADFSGIDGTRSLFISFVLHKAFIGVDEQGTEAAASTAVGVSKGAMNAPKPVIFRADHPFLFLIRERSTGAILFMGKVLRPNASAPE